MTQRLERVRLPIAVAVWGCLRRRAIRVRLWNACEWLSWIFLSLRGVRGETRILSPAVFECREIFQPPPWWGRSGWSTSKRDSSTNLPGSPNRRPGSPVRCPDASRKGKIAGHFAPFLRQGRRNDSLEAVLLFAGCEEHARASPCGKRREQAPALHISFGARRSRQIA